VAAGFAKDFREQVRAAIDDIRMVGELGGRINHAQDRRRQSQNYLGMMLWAWMRLLWRVNKVLLLRRQGMRLPVRDDAEIPYRESPALIFNLGA
jgi:hypothetical protein